ncbi:metallopeptidase family protein [Propionibacteriaceae bacterium Y1700]|uniref:metallopeptidase family protein n=1 Tax=Microlunatus sp. Y1700 TaxID=3418487 RepID=UPI003DA761EC
MVRVAVEMSPEAFEEAVGRALDQVPDELWELINNCVVLVEDDPPAEEPGLLGLYDGIPLTERDSSYSGILPDRIFIYRRPILELCHTVEDVLDEIHITVVHEIAHHFGIDDHRLHDLGYA